MSEPSRGEIWLAGLGPVRGHEQAGTRPVLIVSSDGLNHGLSGLVIVISLTTRSRPLASYVEILPPEGGLSRPSWVQCEQVRSISKERLRRRLGTISPATMSEVETALQLLLDFRPRLLAES